MSGLAYTPGRLAGDCKCAEKFHIIAPHPQISHHWGRIWVWCEVVFGTHPRANTEMSRINHMDIIIVMVHLAKSTLNSHVVQLPLQYSHH